VAAWLLKRVYHKKMLRATKSKGSKGALHFVL
jgi:hypothetical protein